MDLRDSPAVQRLWSASGSTESGSSRIGPINLGMKQMGERSAGNLHAAFDVEGLETWHGRDSGTLADERASNREPEHRPKPAQQASTLPKQP